MSEFVNNLLSPPDKLKVGQIWWAESIKKELVITDSALWELGLVRGALVSRIVELDNGIDLLITPEKYPIYATPRRIISKTAGPLHKSFLTFFRGKLLPKDIQKLREALKTKPTIKYTEIQKRLLSEMLEELHPLRMKTMKLYEAM